MDEKKVVSLKLAEHKSESHPEVVDALENLLTLAKGGKLQSLVAIYMDDRDIGAAIVGMVDQQTVLNYIGMLNVTITDLSHQILQEAQGHD